MLSKKMQSQIITSIVDAIHPIKIILFGSYANGNPTSDSDIDLIVVTENSLPKRKTSVILWNLLDTIPLAKDIIVTSREEFDFYCHEAGSVMRTANEKGVVIHAR
jgi:predicted nucleotidyltransferase